MRAARQKDLGGPVEPVLTARVSPDRFQELVPLPTEEIDPLSAPEPSEGVVARLETGEYAVFEYGKVTHTLKISLTPTAHRAGGLKALLEELALDPDEVVWSDAGQAVSA